MTPSLEPSNSHLTAILNMGKKKSFIDKKNSVTFHLVRRSQRDVSGFIDYEAQIVGDEKDGTVNNQQQLSDFVLMPAPDNSEKYSKIIVPETRSKKEEFVEQSWDDKHQFFKLKQTLEQTPQLLDETFDKYTRPITGEGTFVSATSGNNAGVPNDNSIADDPLIREVERAYESITLNPDLMDPEIADALFGDWEDGEGVFEELLDDFVLTASEEPTAEPLSDDTRNPLSPDLEFDYDAHIRNLMERAHKAQEGHGVPTAGRAFVSNHPSAQTDFSYFKKAKPLNRLDEDHQQDQEQDYDDDDSFANVASEVDDEQGDWGPTSSNVANISIIPGVTPKLSLEAEQALHQKFEATLAEYDTSDEEQDYDDFDMNAVLGNPTTLMTNMNQVLDDESGSKVSAGGRDWETMASMVTTDEEARYNLRQISHQQLESVLDTYLKDREDRQLAEGVLRVSEKRTGGSGHFALMKIKPEEKIEDTQQQQLQQPQELLPEEMEPPPEEVLIDGKSYFSFKQASPWDCESVLTTYSNLDNNPALIARSGRRKNKKCSSTKMSKQDSSHVSYDDESQVIQHRIVLSNKTGLPLDIDNDQDSTSLTGTTCTNKGEARKRGETPQERKTRKATIKAEKQERRLQKKLVKQVFSDEFRKRTGDDTNDVAGLTVFKYS